MPKTATEVTDDIECTAKATPSKTFFIDMLTKDIGITACVLDLIDNSVDGFIRTHNIDASKMLSQSDRSVVKTTNKIDIIFSEKTFEISDDCGGIPLDLAINEVFCFGHFGGLRKKAGLGVYGIGMKRAFFKLGKKVSIRSSTDKDHFLLPIDVVDWRKQDTSEWDFKFKDLGRSHKGKVGTDIKITDLTDEAIERFRTDRFQTELLLRVGSTYALYLKRGLSICVNGIQVRAEIPAIMYEEKKVEPARLEFKIKDVDVELFAGVSAEDDKRPHGWYVFCNGRLLLAADKSRLTGWGDLLPQFHTKYNHFVGHINFSSKNAFSLPWTTTKTNLIEDSPVYQRALRQMSVVARPIVTHLNSWYKEVETEEREADRQVLRTVSAVHLSDVPKKQTAFVLKAEKPKDPEFLRISYSRPNKTLKRIRKFLEKPDMTPRQIGEYTFDYFVEMELKG